MTKQISSSQESDVSQELNDQQDFSTTNDDGRLAGASGGTTSDSTELSEEEIGIDGGLEPTDAEAFAAESEEVDDPGASDADDGEETESFPAELLNAAGLTAEQATAAGQTPESLRQLVRQQDAYLAQIGQQILTQPQPPQQPQVPLTPQPVQQPQQPQPQQPPVQPTPQQAQATNIQQDADGNFVLPPPKEGEWDEDTKTLFQHFNNQYRQELSRRDVELQQQKLILEGLLQQQIAQQQEQYVHQFEGFLNELGDDWKPIFGAGSGREMNPHSVHFQNRVRLDTTANQIQAAMQSRGMPPLNNSELMARALMVAFPDQQIQQVERKAVQQVTTKNRQRMKTHRPTARKGKSLSAEARAIEHANSFMKSRGIRVDDDLDSSDRDLDQGAF